MYFRPKTREELIIEKIEEGIRGIKMGTKKPEDAKVGVFLNKLKELNDGLYHDYLNNYIIVKKEWDKKHYNDIK